MLTSPSSSLRHPILHYSPHLHTKTLTLTPTPSTSLKFQSNPKTHLRLHIKSNNHCLVGAPLLLSPKRCPNIVAAVSKSPKVEEQKFSQEGLVEESLSNGMFRIILANADTIIGYISGKIRKNFIRILPGDKVVVEVSRYDTSRGRIVTRIEKENNSNKKKKKKDLKRKR